MSTHTSLDWTLECPQRRQRRDRRRQRIPNLCQWCSSIHGIRLHSVLAGCNTVDRWAVFSYSASVSIRIAAQVVNNQNTYFYSRHKTVTSEVAEDTDYKGHKW